jgi:hypothetical protein
VVWSLSRSPEVTRIVTAKNRAREFSAAQIRDASRFIESFPPGVRVVVDEWALDRWRFVFREMPKLALEGLDRLTPGSKFRVRSVSILG